MPFVLVASHPSEGTIEHALYGKADVGRDDECEIVLTGPNVSERHAQFFEDGDVAIVCDLRSGEGTLLNGVPLAAETRIDDRDRVTVGDWTVTVMRVADPSVAFVPRAARERELLAAIEARPSDEDARDVYGDWLEENGYADEAELLRLERGLLHGSEAELVGPVRAVANRTPRTWRAVVGRARVEGCAEPIACPRRWSALRPMSRAARACGACGRSVFYAQSIAEARAERAQNRLVAVDVALERSPADIEPTPVVRPPGAERPALPYATEPPTILPFFARPEPPPAVGALLASLGVSPPRSLDAIRTATALSLSPVRARPLAVVPLTGGPLPPSPRPPPPPLNQHVAQVWLSYHPDPQRSEPRDFAEVALLAHASFDVLFRAGAREILGWLDARIGGARDAQHPISRAPFRVYGERWIFHPVPAGNVIGPDACRLDWWDRLPDWAAPRLR